MARIWEEINHRILCSHQGEVVAWCRQEGMPYSLASQLARVILCWDAMPLCGELSCSRCRRFHVLMARGPLLPKPFHQEDWTALLEWTHPKLELDLLQLAVIFFNPMCIEYLWQGPFPRPDRYIDSSGHFFLNHPFHLLLSLPPSFFNSMGPAIEAVDNEIFIRPGMINFCPNVVGKSSAQEPHIGVPPSENSLPIPLMEMISRNHWNPLDLVKTLEPKIGTPAYLLQTLDGPDLQRLVFMTMTRMLGPYSCLASLNRFRTLIEDVCLRGLSARAFYGLVHTLYPFHPSYKDDALLLSCQLTWAVRPKDSLGSTCLRALRELFFMAVHDKVSIRLAAWYLSEDHIAYLIWQFQLQAARLRLCLPREEPPPHYAQAVEVLKSVLENTEVRVVILPLLKEFQGNVMKIGRQTSIGEDERASFCDPYQKLQFELECQQQQFQEFFDYSPAPDERAAFSSSEN